MILLRRFLFFNGRIASHSNNTQGNQTKQRKNILTKPNRKRYEENIILSVTPCLLGPTLLFVSIVRGDGPTRNYEATEREKERAGRAVTETERVCKYLPPSCVFVPLVDPFPLVFLCLAVSASNSAIEARRGEARAHKRTSYAHASAVYCDEKRYEGKWR